MIRVLVESPYAGKNEQEVEDNIEYARKCMVDCLKKGEAPFASHLLYTQPGILDDNILKERRLGIEAGLIWGAAAEKTVVYIDRGVTKGMKAGISRAGLEGRPVEMRSLNA